MVSAQPACFPDCGCCPCTGHRACWRDWPPMWSGSWYSPPASSAPGWCWDSGSGRESWNRWRGCSFRCLGAGVLGGCHHPRVVRAETTMVEFTETIWAPLMFFCIGFMPLEQYPSWISRRPTSAGELRDRVMRGFSLGGPVLAPIVEMLFWSVDRRRMRDTDGDRYRQASRRE